MKTLNGIINRAMTWSAVLALALVAGSCSDSDSDNDGPGDVTFPELKTLTVNAGSDAELTFTADADWVLSSNNSWCRFLDGDFAESTISGKAGDQKISIRVTDADQNYERDDVAEITMKMGDKTQVIYKITRPRKGSSGLTVRDENGQVIDADHPLLIKGGNITSPVETKVTLDFDDANVRFGVLTDKSASWVTLTAQTDGYGITFKEENTDGKNPKYPISVEEGAVITFAAQKNGATLAEAAIPIYYEGLAENALEVDPSYMSVTVSEDGQTMTGEGGVSGSESTVYGSELISTVTTRNDAFEIVEFVPAVFDDMGSLVSDFDFSANGNLDWVTTQKIADESDVNLKNRVKLTVSELPEGAETRRAVVMLFPQVVYDEIKADLAGNIIDAETNDIKSAYVTYTMANLTQEKKNDQPEGSVSFAGYYYSNYDGDIEVMTFEEVNMNTGLTPKMEDISDTPEGEAIFEEYGLSIMPKKNIWKATVPAGLMSDGNNRLGIEAVGAGEKSLLTEVQVVTGLKGEAIKVSVSGVEKSLWSVYITDGGKPSGYQVMVMDTSDDTIEAVCVVQITD
ncbi:MAG: hypothetical protein LUF83_07325 [Alistipes sp.]|nr:hypothetical protein [Alistipes sp.]